MSEKKADAIVLKIDIHCQGCAMKMKDFVLRFPGVEGVKTDCNSNTLAVTGNAVDPVKLQASLVQKTKKNVDILTPVIPTIKPDGKKTDEKPKAANPDKPKETPPAAKELSVVTVVFKAVLHCEGCTNKIRKIVSKYKGVLDVSFDGAKDLVTVKGAIDAKAFQLYLKQKLRRDVEANPVKEEKKEATKNDEKSAEKKEEKMALKKPEDNKPQVEKKVVEAPATKMEINKMENYGYPVEASSLYWLGDGQVGYAMSNVGYYGHYVGRPLQLAFQEMNEDYVVEEYQPSLIVNAPQMFSDENPTACSVM